MRTLVLIAIAGAVAQLVDGGLGMGFGVTSTSIMIMLAGLGPAHASAVVHAAEVGTTFVSGLSHWRFGNVDWKVALTLGIPGAIGAFIGAQLLSTMPLDQAKPLTATILTLIGLNLVWRFSRGRTNRKAELKKPYSRPFLWLLGTIGGTIDATGGGGWGPVTSSTLLSMGRQHPARIIGTVNTAEFLVACAATGGFIAGLWSDIYHHFPAIMALLIGGALTSPVAAWLVSRINPTLLGGFVGTLLVVLNIPIGGFWLKLGLCVCGVLFSVRGMQARRRATIIVETEPQGQRYLSGISP
ncbi:sulfite exporter TauE/SafE family protein [Corynebacterium felinum]|uniref:Probable membrane transporter protein n=1 Tax=Corynebacterium felinum TaxID=131318 RepID=A0ABU2B5R8_9CORY|nr:sulfite exporter TauE/SafE family protein [Corynebacterium felinum]MDF5821748.1 sulfite exporter TauE/SafE family protein [Corynebacterium felinum]MDR7353960.1 putative membrane protein YfcA [Corynebacterium felinum]WJY96133.1 Sulfite exporter TauE/SafE [Corynebacterium felinum]